MIIQKKVNKLENKNYIVSYNKSNEQFYLEETSKFTLPKNIYHDLDYYSDKVLKTFSKLKKNLGVMLSGYKGSGKSLISKHLCIKSKLPVLILNQPFSGDEFNSFIDSIDQEVILLFDEFEKTYKDSEKQEQLLTLMDGVFTNNILFLLTVNSTDLNEFLFNRPSRIRYNFNFDSIDSETLRRITDDLLKDKSFEEDVYKTVRTLGNVGIDLVISLIEDVNIFKESPIKLLDDLNIRLEESEFSYIAHINDGSGKKVKVKGTINKSPLSLDEIVFHKDYWTKEGVDYRENVKAMRKSYISDKIYFEDRLGNNITFSPVKKVKGINNLSELPTHARDNRLGFGSQHSY